MPKCLITHEKFEPCAGMALIELGSLYDKSTGFKLVRTINIREAGAGGLRIRGIAYRYGKKKGESVMINLCPFCGESYEHLLSKGVLESNPEAESDANER